MEEPVDLHEEAGIENEQTLANLKVEIDIFVPLLSC